jgi:hypothetical protein
MIKERLLGPHPRRALEKFVGFVLVSGVVAAVGSAWEYRNGAESTAQNALAPLVQTLETDAATTGEDVKLFNSMSSTNTLRAKLHRIINIDYARDEEDYHIFSYAASSMGSAPYTGDIVSHDVQAVDNTLLAVPGSSTHLDLSLN